MELNSSRAKRLGYVLKRYAEDPDSVEKVARVLNYEPNGLAKDMKALIAYIEELEESCNKK